MTGRIHFNFYGCKVKTIKPLHSQITKHDWKGFKKKPMSKAPLWNKPEGHLQQEMWTQKGKPWVNNSSQKPVSCDHLPWLPMLRYVKPDNMKTLWDWWTVFIEQLSGKKYRHGDHDYFKKGTMNTQRGKQGNKKTAEANQDNNDLIKATSQNILVKKLSLN